MKKDLVEMVFILDRSGSMSGLELETINGFNSLVKKQREVKGEATISTVLFDNKFEVLHNRVNIEDVNQLTRETYFVRGQTALLDAIGRSIQKIVGVYKKLDESNKPEKTMFVITTDGMENASIEYSYNDVKKMIEHQTSNYGWEFIFLGANIDAINTAGMLGIRKERSATYRSDKIGTNLNYQVLDEAITELRVNKNIKDNWKEQIEKDEKTRKA